MLESVRYKVDLFICQLLNSILKVVAKIEIKEVKRTMDNVLFIRLF